MMDDNELKKVVTAYQHVRDRFNDAQVSMLAAMLNHLNQELSKKELQEHEQQE